MLIKFYFIFKAVNFIIYVQKIVIQISNICVEFGADSEPIIQKMFSFKECADIVLVDAPCSGTGTWRRNPDMRAKFQKKDLEELLTVQANILTTASSLIKKGGRLIYSTCSVFFEENEDQIERFLSAFPNFKVEKIHLNDLENVFNGNYLRLSPFRNGTDGFFAARLERIE